MSEEHFSPPRPGVPPPPCSVPDRAGGASRGISTQEGEELLEAVLAMIRDKEPREQELHGWTLWYRVRNNQAALPFDKRKGDWYCQTASGKLIRSMTELQRTFRNATLLITERESKTRPALRELPPPAAPVIAASSLSDPPSLPPTATLAAVTPPAPSSSTQGDTPSESSAVSGGVAPCDASDSEQPAADGGAPSEAAGSSSEEQTGNEVIAVGARISVMWDEGDWYDGEVVEHVPELASDNRVVIKHRVFYDDGAPRRAALPPHTRPPPPAAPA